MTNKAAFSADEWKTLQQAPMVAGMYITIASPSITDSMKESMAVARKVSEAIKGSSGGALVTELMSELTDFSSIRAIQPDFKERTPDGIKAEAIGQIRAVASILDGKVSAADANEYKQWVYDAAVAAAEAAKEGDFLGIGGERVNDEERAALAELKNALGI